MKVLVFDIDGVVVTGQLRFSQRLEAEYGITLETTEEFFSNEFQACLVGKGDLKESIEPYLEDWGWDEGTEGLLRYWFEAEADVDARVVAKVKQLQKAGFVCVAATNQEQYRTEYLRKVVGLEQVFDRVFSSCEIGAVKPDEAFYAYITQALEVLPEDVGFMDDSHGNVKGAKRYGWNAMVYRDFEGFNEWVTGFGRE